MKNFFAYLITILFAVTGYAQETIEVALGGSAPTLLMDQKFGPWTTEESSTNITPGEIEWRLQKDLSIVKTMMGAEPKPILEGSEVFKSTSTNDQNSIQIEYYEYGLPGPFAVPTMEMRDFWLTQIKADQGSIKKFSEFDSAKGTVKDGSKGFFVMSLDLMSASNQILLITFTPDKEDVAWEMEGCI